MTPKQQADLDRLMEALKRLPSSDGLMNPYASAKGTYAADSQDEIGETADDIRLHNFRSIVSSLLDAGSNVILCGEAPGYQGARAVGYAFSSEREVQAAHFPFQDCRLLPGAASGERKLYHEPSALYIWRAMARAKAPAILHNAVPLHPHQPGKAYTNRTPTREEVALGHESLSLLIELVQPRLVVAVGKTAERALRDLGVESRTVRHPSYGGASTMLRQLEELGVIGPPPSDPQQSLF
jgi:uracil-DNA glycosylase